MKYIAVLFFIFIITLILLADTGNLPHWVEAIYNFPNGDKLGHFILFGLLNFFITRAFLSSGPSKSPVWMTLSIGLILALLIAFEEWTQQFFRFRTYSLVDLLASCLGLVVAGWMALRLKK